MSPADTLAAKTPNRTLDDDVTNCANLANGKATYDTAPVDTNMNHRKFQETTPQKLFGNHRDHERLNISLVVKVHP